MDDDDDDDDNSVQFRFLLWFFSLFGIFRLDTILCPAG